MAMNSISIDYISGGKLERQEKNFINIKDMKPSELGNKPIEFATEQGGNNEHIEFKLSLSTSDPRIYADILNRGQIVPSILMSDDGEWRMLKPLRSSNWRFLSDGKATMRIRLEELTGKSCCYIHFSMIDKRGDGDVITSIEPSESIPIRVVSKYRETYQKSLVKGVSSQCDVEKKGKVSKKRKFEIDCEEDVTDNESQDESESPRARVRSVKRKQRTQNDDQCMKKLNMPALSLEGLSCDFSFDQLPLQRKLKIFGENRYFNFTLYDSDDFEPLLGSELGDDPIMC